LYLFYRDLIVACICFIESLSLFVFVLSKYYRCCICFIESLSLFVYALSRASRLYLLFSCDVGEIDNTLEWIQFLYQYFLFVHGAQHQWNLEFIGHTIIILWIRYYLWYAHFLWISWFLPNREIRNSTNMCHHIYLTIKLTSLNWNEFTVSLIIKSGVVLCSIWRDAMFTIAIPQRIGDADRLKYLLW
jgi:hypothetical protein